MKQHLLIATVICCTITVLPATAVVKCVALNTSTTCSGVSSSYSGLDWNATCKTGNTNVPVKGIAGCSSSNSTSIGNTATSLSISPTADYNYYCWCKMTSPAASQWTYAYSFSSGSNCLKDCSYYCVFSLSNDYFRTGMFQSVSD